ncbi:MAG: response regulator [Elusimicrobia bacterium]|nr:response regulator [Elusimicrobiota bacterium]
MKVLVADDDPVSQKLLEAVLSEFGCEVLIAPNGQEAWETFNRQDIDLIISDWMMPEMDGLAFCRKVRRRSNSGYPFFFLITGKKTKVADYCQAMEEGVDDFLYKPIDGNVLKNQLKVVQRTRSLLISVSKVGVKGFYQFIKSKPEGLEEVNHRSLTARGARRT